MADRIKIEILEDGKISVETDGVSGKNHHSADEFLNDIEKYGGGERETQKKKVARTSVVQGQNVKHSH